ETDFALAWADVSTGETAVLDLGAAALGDEIARIGPAELLLTEATRGVLAEARVMLHDVAVTELDAALFDSEQAAARIAAAFPGGEVDATAFSRAGRAALGALVEYVRDSQKGVPVALRAPN